MTMTRRSDTWMLLVAPTNGPIYHVGMHMLPLCSLQQLIRSIKHRRPIFQIQLKCSPKMSTIRPLLFNSSIW
jgi:hypothetical protein